MTDDVEQMSLALVDELEQSAAQDRAPIDPRTVPSRFSLLKQMNLSPAHYFHACQSPQDDTLASRLGSLGGFVRDRKEALRMGTAIHELLLGNPDKIGRYVGRRAGKAWEAFQQERAAEGCTEILNEKEWAQASNVVEAIRRRADAMRLLLDGTIIEQRIDWMRMDKAIRSTPDARSKLHVVDLKSAISSEPETFRRQSLKLFYHAQASLYGDAMEANGEGRPADSFVIAVEKTAPFPVTIFRFTAELLELGQKLNRLWLERLLNCERNNHWPVYAPCPAVVDLEMDDRDY